MFWRTGIIAFVVVMGIVSCQKKAAPSIALTNRLTTPDSLAGLELTAKSDCLTCHKISERLVGPSYKEIANKYEMNDRNVAKLSEKIINGGPGVWGQIPMVPHPQMSRDTARLIVKFILSLKN